MTDVSVTQGVRNIHRYSDWFVLFPSSRLIASWARTGHHDTTGTFLLCDLCKILNDTFEEMVGDTVRSDVEIFHSLDLSDVSGTDGIHSHVHVSGRITDTLDLLHNRFV